ncbi:lipocalin-like domain-containing protein [Kaistia terrae]|uniref:Lipocalin-like domain-containing protein n=1 Tax=Kaistia terrae TaxID=537017 RepID=A0ABW0Q0K6_9HYPH|nr:lipocalin-like domain-containing protein [Kaistia terrae]MCX5576802.1 lipocalin-like domain-containing protein [Kaistia terrae]
MDRDRLLGSWTLKSFVFETINTGERSEPFGANPSGTILFHADGRFFALMTPSDRPLPRTEAEQAAAFQSLVAYSGRYRIEPPNRLVTHVDIAWFPPWVGSDQVRYYTLDGDHLDLVSAPLRLPSSNGEEATVFARVSWMREKVVVDDASPPR